jgi:hypothetical protein
VRLRIPAAKLVALGGEKESALVANHPSSTRHFSGNAPLRDDQHGRIPSALAFARNGSPETESRIRAASYAKARPTHCLPA